MLKLCCIDLLPKPTGTRTGDILTNSLISCFKEFSSADVLSCDSHNTIL